MADFLAHFGAMINVSVTPKRVRLVNMSKEGNAFRGVIINKGSLRVYVGWNKDVVHKDSTEEADKAYIASQGAIPVPHNVSFVSLVTAAGTSKVLYIASNKSKIWTSEDD